MLNRQDYDRINKSIEQRNAARQQRKAAIITFVFFIMAILSCTTINHPPLLFLFDSVLILAAYWLIRRMGKRESPYTFEQYASDRAAQKAYLRQREHEISYPQVKDTRYIPDQLRQAVSQRDAYRCQICGSSSYLELDHIIPHAKGGATSYENLQVLCRSCNQRKGAS